MSAFLVDRVHIDLLVKLALQGPRGVPVSPGTAWHPGYYLRDGHDTPDALGALLWIENLRSIEARYPHDGDGKRPGPNGLLDAEIASYTYTDPYYQPTIAEALQAINCYEYQSCEHDEWEHSTTAALCDRLRRDCVRHLPGMDKAPWEWTPATLVERRAGRLDVRSLAK